PGAAAPTRQRRRRGLVVRSGRAVPPWPPAPRAQTPRWAGGGRLPAGRGGCWPSPTPRPYGEVRVALVLLLLALQAQPRPSRRTRGLDRFAAVVALAGGQPGPRRSPLRVAIQG